MSGELARASAPLSATPVLNGLRRRSTLRHVCSVQFHPSRYYYLFLGAVAYTWWDGVNSGGRRRHLLAKTAFFVAGGIKVGIPMSTGVYIKPRREEATAGPCAPPENRAVLSIRCDARSHSRGALEIVRGMPTKKKSAKAIVYGRNSNGNAGTDRFMFTERTCRSVCGHRERAQLPLSSTDLGPLEMDIEAL